MRATKVLAVSRGKIAGRVRALTDDEKLRSNLTDLFSWVESFRAPDAGEFDAPWHRMALVPESGYVFLGSESVLVYWYDDFDQVVHMPRLAPIVGRAALLMYGSGWDGRFYLVTKGASLGAVIYCGADEADWPRVVFSDLEAFLSALIEANKANAPIKGDALPGPLWNEGATLEDAKRWRPVPKVKSRPTLVRRLPEVLVDWERRLTESSPTFSRYKRPPHKDPVGKLLTCGISDAPAEIVELYKWADGVRLDVSAPVEELSLSPEDVLLFLPLEDAITHDTTIVKMSSKRRKRQMLPIFWDGSTGYHLIGLSAEDKGRLFYLDPEEGAKPRIVAESVAELFETALMNR
jgi:hypothetical protein